MICLRRKKCDKIVNRLIQEYHSRHHREANQLIAEVQQDHISRGFANSTIVVSKKLSVKYDYIDKLVDSLLQSLERDFPNFPLKDCKQILIKSVEAEYKKLHPTVNAWLMEACMAQQGKIEQFNDSILRRFKETQKNIEIRCELSNEKQKQKKWLDDPVNRWKTTTAIAILTAVIGWSFAIISLFFNPNTPKPPNLGFHFTDSTANGKEIGITGPFGKKIYSVPMRLTLENSTKRTAEDACLTFVTPNNISVTSNEPRAEPNIVGTGKSAKNRTDILLGAIHPSGFGKPSNCNAELRWSSISFIASLRFGRPFVFNEITNRIEEFVIDGEITTKDMPAAKVKLKISIGTREAFNATGYKGEIFEINDKGELVKTAL
jgi:hypothetical protein